jgi:hypothetical protein
VAGVGHLGSEWVKVGLTQGPDPRSASQPKPQVGLWGWAKLAYTPSARQRCQPVGHVNYLIRVFYMCFLELYGESIARRETAQQLISPKGQ